MLDCNQATLLISRKLDGRLSLWEQIRLKIHLMNCKFCHNFNLQSEKIDKIIKITPDELEHKCNHIMHLEADKKQKIIDKLKKE